MGKKNKEDERTPHENENWVVRVGIHGDIVSFYQQRHTKYRYFIKYIKILWDYYEQQGWSHARKSCSNVRWANLHLNKKNIQHWAHQAWQSYFLFQSIQCLSHVGQNKTAPSLHLPIATCGDKSFFSTSTYSAWLYSVFRIFRSETDC